MRLQWSYVCLALTHRHLCPCCFVDCEEGSCSAVIKIIVNYVNISLSSDRLIRMDLNTGSERFCADVTASSWRFVGILFKLSNKLSSCWWDAFELIWLPRNVSKMSTRNLSQHMWCFLFDGSCCMHTVPYQKSKVKSSKNYSGIKISK